MGKVTLGVLVLAIAAGVYWFWWSDQGANSPITVEGTFSISGMPAMPGVSALQGTIKGNVTLQAVPNKLRLTQEFQGLPLKGSVIVRLDKRVVYVIDENKKTYESRDFDLVEMSQTELHEGKETWPSEFLRAADWEYIGRDEGKRFCNKQTGLPKELVDAAKGAPGGTGSILPGMEGIAKNAKAEFWFTPDTRLGRRYFAALNKLTRIRLAGTKADEKQKRPQFKYGNLDFFPIPMRAVISAGGMRMELEVKNLSRGRIAKDVFEIPSGYKQEKSQHADAGPSNLPSYGPQGQPSSEPRMIIVKPTRTSTPQQTSTRRPTTVRTPQRTST
jgi:hypothetical protein